MTLIMDMVQPVPYPPHVAYLPNSITQVPKPVIEYARYMEDAPVVALAPVRADGVQQQPIEKSRRHRTRLQVGQTNRWRLPQSLLSDLLGRSQAHKSLQGTDFKPSNSSYVRICTAEGRHSFLNEDVNHAFVPVTSFPDVGNKSLRSSLPSSFTSLPEVNSRLAKSAPIKPRLSRTGSSRISSYIPERAIPATTKDVFLYHSKHRDHKGSPDVVLHCLDMDFELHSSVLNRSPVLAALYKEAMEEEPADTVYYKSQANEPLDSLIQSAGLYENTGVENYSTPPEREVKKPLNHPAHTCQAKHASIIKVKLELPQDSHVSQNGMAVALGNLYHPKLSVDNYDLPSVLLAADAIGFMQLVYHCVDCMRTNISYYNISPFYLAAMKTCQTDLSDSCLRWLELNLIPVMMTKIQLRDIPVSLLETTLKSSRLFTYGEYSLYTCLSLWLFLKINPHIQLLPTPTNVITYFNSLPKHSSYLERDGQIYQPLFDTLRLHGITDTSHFDNIRLMNILTQESMVSLLSEHYTSLQSGGDMNLIRNFRKSAVRQGIIIDQDIPYHSEILSLHGFHFELKSVRTDGTYTFFMQRLKPTDTILSFRHCERQTFSMRPDRDVIYSITVQAYSRGVQTLSTTDVQTQRFTLNGKLTRSKVLSVKDMSPPLYVTYALLFPQS